MVEHSAWTGVEVATAVGGRRQVARQQRPIAIPDGFVVVAATRRLEEGAVSGSARLREPQPGSAAHLRDRAHRRRTLCAQPCQDWYEFPGRGGLLPAVDSCDECRRLALLRGMDDPRR